MGYFHEEDVLKDHYKILPTTMEDYVKTMHGNFEAVLIKNSDKTLIRYDAPKEGYYIRTEIGVIFDQDDLTVDPFLLGGYKLKDPNVNYLTEEEKFEIQKELYEVNNLDKIKDFIIVHNLLKPFNYNFEEMVE